MTPAVVPTSAVLLVAMLVLVLVLALVVLLGRAWAMRRRAAGVPVAARAAARAVATASGQGDNATSPDDGADGIVAVDAAAAVETSADSGLGAATPTQLLHRVYAAAFDDASRTSASTEGAVATDSSACPGAAASPEPPAGTERAGAATGGHAEVVAAAEAVLGRIESQPRYTPRRPQLLPQLMRAVNDADGSLRTIAGIVAQDPALAGNLLRIANSPLYRVRAQPIESVERAAAVLGTDGIRQSISAALVQPVMNTDDSALGRLAAAIWDHTLLASAAAADHAARVERGDAFAAQLLALLQGLASIIVVQVARDQYARQPLLAPDAGVVLALLEAWRDPTAARIVASWQLSERIGQALVEQRGEGDATGEPAPASALGRSLRFGRLAGTLALLARRGDLSGPDALARLGASPPGGAAVASLWQRLHAAG